MVNAHFSTHAPMRPPVLATFSNCSLLRSLSILSSSYALHASPTSLYLPYHSILPPPYHILLQCAPTCPDSLRGQPSESAIAATYRVRARPSPATDQKNTRNKPGYRATQHSSTSTSSTSRGRCCCPLLPPRRDASRGGCIRRPPHAHPRRREPRRGKGHRGHRLHD